MGDSVIFHNFANRIAQKWAILLAFLDACRFWREKKSKILARLNRIAQKWAILLKTLPVAHNPAESFCENRIAQKWAILLAFLDACRFWREKKSKILARLNRIAQKWAILLKTLPVAHNPAESFCENRIAQKWAIL